jgi:hypothetical protein
MFVSETRRMATGALTITRQESNYVSFVVVLIAVPNMRMEESLRTSVAEQLRATVA